MKGVEVWYTENAAFTPMVNERYIYKIAYKLCGWKV